MKHFWVRKNFSEGYRDKNTSDAYFRRLNVLDMVGMVGTGELKISKHGGL